MRVKVLKHVTLPLLKIKPNGPPALVRFESAMFKGKQVDDKKEAATLAHVLDLETGAECQIICPMLLRERLAEAYPKDGYVGKQFQITVTRVPEKKYNEIGLSEVEVDADDIGSKRPTGNAMEAPDAPASSARAAVEESKAAKPAKRR